MAFYPAIPLLSTAGGTITGALTVAGLLTTQLGIQNSGANIGSATNIQNTGGSGYIGGSVTTNLGGVDVGFLTSGLSVKEGANGRQGTFALSGAATTVVANTSVTVNSRILMTTQALGTVSSASTLCVSARSAGTSFTVTPSQSTDTSTIAYEIFEPG